MDDDTVEYLISIGALEFDGIDEDDQPLYRFTDSARELVPELYKEHMKDFNALVFSLWSKDFVDVVFDENGEPLISISENSFDEKKYQELGEEEFSALSDIIDAWEELEE
jgi:hypothetical protein